MRFPIVLKTLERFRAPAKLYYEVAANGVFQVRDAPTHRAVTRVEHDVPGLLPEFESIELRVPMLPRDLLENVLAFFYEVNERWAGEAIVVLFFDVARQEFQVGVPSQTIGAYRDAYGHVWTDNHLEYGSVDRPEGCVRFGTIHSHGNLAAYASHTDCQDERWEDGVHAVYGNLKSSRISQSASFVANGRRFPLDPAEVLESASVPAHGPPPEWMDQVSYVETSRGGAGNQNVISLDDYAGYGGYGNGDGRGGSRDN